MKNIRVLKALAKPKSRKEAIRQKCLECQGYGIDPGGIQRVRECTSMDTCPLWHLRPYQDAQGPQTVDKAGSMGEG